MTQAFFPCCITKDTITHLEYVIDTSFSRQQRLRERATNLCYTYIANLSVDKKPTRCHVLSFISPLQVAQHVSGNHVPVFRS